MTYNYTPLTASAGRMIAKFGQQYTFTRTTKGAYNPATGQTSDSSATFTGYACLFDYSDADRADGTILQGDRRMLAEGGTYEVGDTVVVGSDTYRVINISDIGPGGSVVASNLQIRK
jgi:hypothetical protein